MKAQRENPEGVASIVEFDDHMTRTRGPDYGRVSGAQIENFRKGWALRAMPWSATAHWFKRRGFDEVRSRCGLVAPVRWMYGRGNFPKCARCVSMGAS